MTARAPNTGSVRERIHRWCNSNEASWFVIGWSLAWIVSAVVFWVAS